MDPTLGYMAVPRVSVEAIEVTGSLSSLTLSLSLTHTLSTSLYLSLTLSLSTSR